MERRRTSRLVWARRATQTAFLLLFLILFLGAAGQSIDRPGRGVKLFFEIDPLAALATWLASHALPAGMLLALATLAVTFLAGRWFCGWACPFGTLHHFCASLRRRGGAAQHGSGAYSPWQKSKYYLLAACLGGALAGVNLAGWLDPICFFFRSLATSIYPAFQDAVTRVFSWIYDADPGIGPARLTALSEPVYAFLRSHALAARQPQYFGNVPIAALLAGALALNFLRPRFWCRFLCPLGALLGVAGKNPLVRLEHSAEACNDCRLCQSDCQGGANPNAAWKPAECLYCFNCQSACPNAAIHIARPAAWLRGFFRPPKSERLDLGRRRVLTYGAAGLSAAFVFHTQPLGRARSFHAGLVRPPGALPEDAFLSACLRCGECMKVCPTNAIQPAALEPGLEGVWTPVLKMTLGYCEYECTLCGQVCPSGAIRPMEVAAKQSTRIGIAYVDRGRCLPYAFARPCVVCEEHCPTPKKAIWLEETRLATPAGSVAVKQPHVDPDLCIGCGVCENKCVVKGDPAIRVSSAGETRNPRNRVWLQ